MLTGLPPLSYAAVWGTQGGSLQGKIMPSVLPRWWVVVVHFFPKARTK